MDRTELLDCLRAATDALAEFRHVLPAHSPTAQAQVDEARRHLDYAAALLELEPPPGGPASAWLAN